MQNELSFVSSLMFFGANKSIEHALASGVEECWFTKSIHAKIWRVALEIYAENKEVQSISITNRDPTISKETVLKIMDAQCPWPDSILAIEGFAVEYKERRFLADIDECRAAVVRASHDNKDAALAIAKDRLLSADYIKEGRKEPDMIEETIKEITYWQETPVDDRTGLRWPLASIDRIIGPITDELVFLSAMPSVGKTAFALAMMVHAADHATRIGFASLETPAKRLGARFMTIASGINATKLRLGKEWILGQPHGAFNEDYDLARETLAKYKGKHGWTFEARTLEQIGVWAKMEKDKGAKAIIIDNMKHIQMPSNGMDLPAQFRALSLGLKDIRDKTGIAVIVLHHLNQKGEQSWSGDIKRDADIIVNLHDIDKDTPPDDASVANKMAFIVDKNRDGQTGATALSFLKRIQKFEDMEMNDVHTALQKFFRVKDA